VLDFLEISAAPIDLCGYGQNSCIWLASLTFEWSEVQNLILDTVLCKMQSWQPRLRACCSYVVSCPCSTPPPSCALPSLAGARERKTVVTCTLITGIVHTCMRMECIGYFLTRPSSHAPRTRSRTQEEGPGRVCGNLICVGCTPVP
jgi:hypothetical protein